MLDLQDHIKYRELFFDESKKIISNIKKLEQSVKKESFRNDLFRAVHTLKAMSQVMGFDSLSRECHKFEIFLKDKRPSSNETSFFAEKISLLLEREEKPLLYASSVKGLDLSDDDFETILNQLGFIIDAISPLSDERKKLIFKFLKEIYSRLIPNKVVKIGSVKKYILRVISTYQRSRQKNINLSFSGEETIVDSKIINTLNQILVQIIRNSIVHGLESYENGLKGKREKKLQIHLNVKNLGRDLIIDVGDDGRGIDYDKLKTKLLSQSSLNIKKEDLNSIDYLNRSIFLPNVTTKDNADELSGMGFGLSQVKELLTSIDGVISAKSKKDKGVNFHIVIPSKVFYLNVKIFSVGETLLAIEPSFVTKTKKVKNKKENDDIKIENNTVIDFIKFFKSEKERDYISVFLDFSDRQYEMIFKNEEREEEIIILSRQNDLFWKGFTKNSQMVSLINLDYVRMNY